MSSQDRRRALIDEAMRALRSRDPAARQWSMEVADTYRQRVRYRAPRFSELRRLLGKEAGSARELALLMDDTTAMMGPALHFLRGGECPQDAIFQRHEVSRDLKLHADEIERLMNLSTWPRGGDWDLAKAYFGPPKLWLAWQGIRAFFHYGDPREIKPMSVKNGSRYGDYVGAIYELSTDECPWDKGVGLDKIIDKAAREWRRNRPKAISP
jgi:hypothetical protein